MQLQRLDALRLRCSAALYVSAAAAAANSSLAAVFGISVAAVHGSAAAIYGSVRVMAAMEWSPCGVARNASDSACAASLSAGAASVSAAPLHMGCKTSDRSNVDYEQQRSPSTNGTILHGVRVSDECQHRCQRRRDQFQHKQ